MVEFSALLQSSLNGRRVTSADPRWSLNESRLDLMPASHHSLSLSLCISFFVARSSVPSSQVQITFTAEKIAFPTPEVCFRRNLSSPRSFLSLSYPRIEDRCEQN